jgi:hypothetical protein
MTNIPKLEKKDDKVDSNFTVLMKQQKKGVL